MKRTSTNWAYAFFILFLLVNNPLKATEYYWGGEITYNVVSQDSVDVYLTLYSDCMYSYYTTTTSYYLNVNTCDTSYKQLMSKVSSQDVTPKCPSACTRCSNNYSCFTYIGIYKDVYKTRISLKHRNCSSFTFSYTDDQRSTSITSGPANSKFYLEAVMTKGSNGFVSSPVFARNPMSYLNTNMCVANYQNASSASSDSLYYTLTSPLIASGKGVTYSSPYSYKIPFKFNGFPNAGTTFTSSGCEGLHLDSLTGLITFDPTSAIVTPMAIKVTQYAKKSNGSYEKVGEITREMTLDINKWSTVPSSADISSISDINVYYGESIDVCSRTIFKIKISDNGYLDHASLYLQQKVPGLDTVSGYSSKTKTFTFTMVPSRATIGKTYHFAVEAVDNFCPIQYSSLRFFTIRVLDSMPAAAITHVDKGCGRYYLRVSKGQAKGNTYQWQLDTFSKASTDTSFYWTFTKNGDYPIQLTLTRASGCSKVVTDTIKVHSILSPDAGKDTTICQGTKGQLHATGATYYKWAPSTGLSADNVANPYVSPDQTTVYHLTATDSNGCPYHDSVKVTIFPFYLNLVNDTSICLGGQAWLKADAPQGVVYSWSPSTGLDRTDIASPLASPVKTTTYTLSILNTLGCKLSKSVTVKVYNPIANAGTNKKICRGDSVQLSASGGIAYQWEKAPGITQTDVSNPYVKPLNDQYYKVSVFDSLGCSDEDSVLVEVGHLDSISVTGTNQTCPGDTSMLKAMGGSFYLWTPAYRISDVTAAQPKVYPNRSTYYKVTIMDAKHICTHEDSVLVSIDNDCVWPGDANRDSIVNHLDLLNLGVANNDSGNTRNGASWRGYKVPNWGKSTGAGIEYKHIDANGDGYINAQDTTIISRFYGYTHGTPRTLPRYKPTDPILYVHFPADTLYAGDTVRAKVYIGTPSKSVKTLYGIGTTMSYKDQWMVPGSFILSLPCQFPCGNATHLSMNRPSGTTVQFSIVRTDHSDTSGYGALGEIQFVLKDTNAGYSPKGEWVSFYFKNTQGVDKSGKTLAVFGESDSVVVMRKRKASTLGIENTLLGNMIKIYPNPAKDILYIDHKNLQVSKITIYNVLGEAVDVNIVSSSDQSHISLDQLPGNMYFVRIQTPEGIYQDKFLIQR